MKSNALPDAALPGLLHEALWFGRQQILACLFGICLLAGLLLTRSWDSGAPFARQDFLFLYALGLQIALIVFRFEHRDEILVIFTFHVLATLMEWFKTSPAIGSWQYPAEGVIFRVYEVPLFAGFLYSSVGSYIARAWRLLEFRFEGYPPVWATVVLAVLAYANFFTHHFVPDIRMPLLVASVLLFGRCRIHFRTGRRERSLPLLVALLFVATMIWIAENTGTYARAWVYPDQEAGWKPVSVQKLWAWYLLMILSFVLVSLVNFRKGTHEQGALPRASSASSFLAVAVVVAVAVAGRLLLPRLSGQFRRFDFGFAKWSAPLENLADLVLVQHRKRPRE